MNSVHIFDFIDQFVNDFYTCRIKNGLNKLDRIIPTVIDMMNVYMHSNPNSEIIFTVNQILLSIEDSLKNCDYVLTADLFQNELLPCIKEMI
ncbi:hypothetical protein [Anaerosolibacter sp.]|uniref:hypothetical protein n=1 Tax=Anaerosolibacter sp. TaxID=1872527 RepID=UPI0039EFED9F